MSFFSNKFAGKKGIPVPQPSKPPVVRREARVVSNPQPSIKSVSQRSSSTPQPQPTKTARTPETDRNATPPAKAVLKRTPDSGTRITAKERTRSIRNGESKKRKVSSPAAPAFGSDSEGTSSQDGNDFLSISRKRARTETGSPEPDLARKVRDVDAWATNTPTEAEANPCDGALIHGADLTKKEQDKFIGVFVSEDDSVPEVELKYPCPGRKERFQLVVSKESDGYKPLEDISETITQILTHFLPPSVSEQQLDPSRGIPYRLSKALRDRSLETYKAVISEFNNLIEAHLTNSEHSIANLIDNTFIRIPFGVVTRLLNQTYARTVSPQVDSLKKYENGTDFVYGELNYPFVSRILRQDTHLKSSQVFLDLGSGVGNVVLQAALETGCEAHGIEIMSNPCALAAAQADEFRARCRLWGLNAGKVTVTQGDFLEEESGIFSLLRRADVVLVNNQAFLPALNENITSYLFLELKEGAKVVSLKNFQQGGWQLNERNSNSVMGMFKVKKGEYYRNWVSWMDAGGHYFLAEKDSKIIQEFQSKKARRSASAR